MPPSHNLGGYRGYLMLILTRRIGETLKIGDDVSLMVLGVQGNQVRIGADAPKHIAIHREEIYRRIQQEKLDGVEPRVAPAAKPRVNKEEEEPYVREEFHSPRAPVENTRFYSTEGANMGKPQKKAPNVIVKKKRVIENV